MRGKRKQGILDAGSWMRDAGLRFANQEAQMDEREQVYLAALAGLLQSRLAQVLTAPAEALDTFARLQITLIGAVVREAITLPPPEAQRLLAQFKRGLGAPDFG